jgi:hypothetical protein
MCTQYTRTHGYGRTHTNMNCSAIVTVDNQERCQYSLLIPVLRVSVPRYHHQGPIPSVHENQALVTKQCIYTYNMSMYVCELYSTAYIPTSSLLSS